MKIVIVGMTLKPEVVSALAEACGPVAVIVEEEAMAVAAMPDADAVVVSDNAYTPALATAIRNAPRLRWMQIVTAGYDNITRLGAPQQAEITSVGDAFSPSVAVHAISLMLALQRGIHTMAEHRLRRHWDKTLAPTLAMPEDKTLLVVGYGSIGHEVARLALPLGMKVVGLNRTGAPHPMAAQVHKIDALHQQLGEADVVVVATPLNPSTEGLIGARELALMKRSALLINVSRGKVVDTMALAAALQDGRIAGAGLDVTEPEPLPPDNPLWDAPNVIISPHVAGAAGSYGARRQIERASANLRRFLAGKPLEHHVRP